MNSIDKPIPNSLYNPPTVTIHCPKEADKGETKMNKNEKEFVKHVVKAAISWNNQVAAATGMESPLTQSELKEILRILGD